MATLKQIAEIVNVSTATVSRVLNRDEGLVVSTEVKNKIFDTAHELNYLPPKRRHIKAEKGISIGIADWHILRKDVQNIKLAEYDKMARHFCKTPIAFKRMIYGEKLKVDGIIALGKFSEKEITYLKEQSYAILFINSDRQDYQYDRIIMDYDEGLMRMVDYIFETKHYDSLGYIGGYYESEEVTIGKTRYTALIRILKDRGKYLKKYFLIGEMSKQSGYDMAKECIERKCLPRAVLLGSDQIAEGALEAFKEAGLKVPQEVEPIIYKDIETLKSKFPGYTSVHMFPDFMWEMAIKLLIERIIGKRKETMTVIIPSKLCIAEDV